MATSFRLAHTIPFSDGPFQTVACFPWQFRHLATLWQGRWGNCIAAASKTCVLLISAKQPTERPLVIKLPYIDTSSLDKASIDRDVTQVAWAFRPAETVIHGPLLLITTRNILIIFDLVTRTIIGRLRGHGYSITSITVHPISPHIFCTTSRDMTTRMYDLTLTPIQTPSNPCWPPEKFPSRAGPAFGLHACEPEGDGIGRCVAVLVGGKAGGNKAAVLGAAFHPLLPLIATCGLDRSVKIWYVRPKFKEMLAREDKPLLSSSRVHQAAVHSISWLGRDILVSFCSPPIFPEAQEDGGRSLRHGRGTLAIWQWLGTDRFFPPEFQEHDVRPGCALDYQESSSFKLIAEFAFPHQATYYSVPKLHCSTDLDEPVIVYTYPGSQSIQILQPANMTPRPRPPFPCETTETGDNPLPDLSAFPNGWQRNLNVLPLSTVEGLQLTIKPEDGEAGGLNGTLEACTIGLDGQAIVGVGSCSGTDGAIWIWLAES